MECPQCKGVDCTRIEIHLKDENDVQFHSCRNCEAKWWLDESGGTIALDDFLTLAARAPRTRARSR